MRLDGIVGQETFGFDRYMNQYFYRSKEWRRVRDIVIARDAGCDLGVPGHEIFGRVLIHHMNPIRPEDIRSRSDILLNPEYLITTVHETHQAVHYGDESVPVRGRGMIHISPALSHSPPPVTALAIPQNWKLGG